MVSRVKPRNKGGPLPQPMLRISGRNDVFLIGGLALAVWLEWSRQLGRLIDAARAIDPRSGFQAVPTLFVLAAFFFAHQFRKRQEMLLEAKQATTRVAEME